MLVPSLWVFIEIKILSDTYVARRQGAPIVETPNMRAGLERLQNGRHNPLGIVVPIRYLSG